MSHRIERLLAVLVMLLALLVVAQTTVLPRNQTLGGIGVGTASLAILYAFVEFVNAR